MNKDLLIARILMVVSGLMGATLFVLANIVQLFAGMNLLAGLLQIAVNTFVFFSWKRGYTLSTGRAKLVALIGTIVPCLMASITLVRVIIPELIKALPH